MSQNAIVVLVVIVLIVIAVAVILAIRKRRSERLRDRYGTEYDRLMRQEGNARKAEKALEFREKRREKFRTVPLSEADRRSFAARWDEVQAQFVDDPRGAVTVAEALLTEVMQREGYPIGDFEQRAADISVDYPRIVEHYRAGHELAVRRGTASASTEDLRQAMVHYRVLFQELLEERYPQRKGA